MGQAPGVRGAPFIIPDRIRVPENLKEKSKKQTRQAAPAAPESLLPSSSRPVQTNVPLVVPPQQPAEPTSPVTRKKLEYTDKWTTPWNFLISMQNAFKVSGKFLDVNNGTKVFPIKGKKKGKKRKGVFVFFCFGACF